MYHLPKTHYSVIPEFHYSNCERSELSFCPIQFHQSLKKYQKPFPVIRIAVPCDHLPFLNSLEGFSWINHE